MKVITLEQVEMFRARLDKSPREIYVVPDVYHQRWRLSLRKALGAQPCGTYTQTIEPSDLLEDALQAIKEAA